MLQVSLVTTTQSQAPLSQTVIHLCGNAIISVKKTSGSAITLKVTTLLQTLLKTGKQTNSSLSWAICCLLLTNTHQVELLSEMFHISLQSPMQTASSQCLDMIATSMLRTHIKQHTPHSSTSKQKQLKMGLHISLATQDSLKKRPLSIQQPR